MGDKTCMTCAFWSNVEPPLATGQRRPNGADEDIGICRSFPPRVVEQGGMVTSCFPQTHYSRTCGEWLADDGDGPDDGERVIDFGAERDRRAA